MKLILTEYLASLKERNELDALLPDLLSEMGMVVTSVPQRGTSQNGVDIVAEYKNKIYLFSVKDGNLTRDHWNAAGPQSLRPSLEDILDSYIPNRIINEQFENKKIVICLCFGGVILEQVRERVTGFINRHTREKISFEIWNGDQIADLILKHLLKETLLKDGYREELRRSIAMIEEPQECYKYFENLLNLISESSIDPIKKIRLINLSLWVLYTWSRNANNLEGVYLTSERALFFCWEIIKDNFSKKKYNEAFYSLLSLYKNISKEYIDKLIPFVDKQYALSAGSNYGSSINVNLKMFDILGRFAMYGHWLIFDINNEQNEEFKKDKIDIFCKHLDKIELLIKNNPILYTPIKDSQVIDVSLLISVFCFSWEDKHIKFIKEYIALVVRAVNASYSMEYLYPCIYEDFDKLLNHSKSNEDYNYKEATAASLLLPVLALVCGIFNDEESFNILKKIKVEKLSHCNFQLWFPRYNSEIAMTTSLSRLHGACWSNIPIQKSIEDFLKEVELMLSRADVLSEFNLIKNDLSALLLVSCRHFRQPVPLNYII
mgnify:CR=1 FL=1